MKEKIIVALDTSDIEEAIGTIKKLRGHIDAFKIGQALTLANGLSAIARLQDAGAKRIFLDLKFHDIPNSVALGVKTAAQYGVWMLTIHTSGGRAMMEAAANAAQSSNHPPLVVGVTVLTSINEETLRNELGVERPLKTQVIELAKLAQESGLDGVVASPHEASSIRQMVGSQFVIVTPGIRPAGGTTHDQQRIATAHEAIANGASYLVVGRAITESEDPIAALNILVGNGQ